METQVLQDTFTELMAYYRFFVFMFIIPFALNLWILFAYAHNLHKMLRKMWFVTPIIFLLLGIALLSGANVWFFSGLRLDFGIIVMFVFCVFVLVGEIFRFKLLKVARRTNMEAMRHYIRFAKMLYVIDLALLLLLLLLV